MKVVTVLGTRPEIIRLSEVMRRLDEACDHKVVHTGQNYDYELNRVFFDELGVRPPDVFLEVKADALGEQLGRILAQTEAVLRRERPDAVLILGDTNSALAAIVAKRLKIPVFHMEAGNRCFDDNVPEEVNRRIVDHTSDINLPYTDHAKVNLLREGLRPDRIVVTGSPLPEIFERHRAAIASSSVLASLAIEPGRYLLVSVHREENVDDPAVLTQLLEALESLTAEHGVPAIVSTHPRTRKRIDALGRTFSSALRFSKPFGFFDYVHLQQAALCNISDSGTIHEDAAILGIPAVVVRTATERPEAIDAGSVVLCGVDKSDIAAAVRLVVSQHRAGVRFPPPKDYLPSPVADKVARLIIGQARLVKARVWGKGS